MKNSNVTTLNTMSNSNLLERDLLLVEEDNGMLPALTNVQDPGSGFNRLLNNTFGLSPLIPDPLERLLQSYVVLEYYGLLAGTPGSDAYLVGRPEKNDTLLTRQGKDILLAVDPSAENPGQGEIDTLAGDRDIFEVFATKDAPIVEENVRSWEDRFILGDAKQPYYLGSGVEDYASILDFNPEQDIIQLHGTPENYQLSESSGNTGIYWHQEGEPELVAILSGVSGLSLDEDYFEYAEDISLVEPTVSEIEQLGTTGVDLSVGIGSDNADGIYLTGTSGDDYFWVTKYGQNGEQQWLQESPSTGNLATDNWGNVYVGGGLGDVEITKYDSDGNQLWTQSLGTFSLDNSFNLDVDNSGNVYLVGYTLDDLGGENAGELTAGSMPIVSTDAWIAKYDTDGNQQWLEQFGSGDFDEAFAIATDKSSNVYTSGWTFGELGGTNAGLYDVWVAKHDSDGNQLWLEQFGTPDYDWSWDAAVDSEDNLYLTGWTLGDLGGVNAGSYDGWVAKYDPDGEQQWVKQFGTAGDDTARSIDFDDSGNFYLTGYSDADFGGANSGSYDTWVAKYDPDGNQLWKQQFGTAQIDNPFELTVDNRGQVLVTGFTEGSLGSANAGSHDAWLAVLSSEDGTLVNFARDDLTANLLPDSSLPAIDSI